MANKQRRQLFPEKLWDLVNKPASGIKWSNDGKRIEVDRGQLEKFLQTKQCDRSFQCQETPASLSSTSSSSSALNQTKFRSHNFDSFIRQLHFYGFKKAGNSYYHDKFQRGQPEALHAMKRKYSNLTFSTSHHLECDSRVSKLSKQVITSTASRILPSSTSYGPSSRTSSIASTRSLAAISAASISKKASKITMEPQVASITSCRKPTSVAKDNSNKKITVYTMRPTNSIEDFSFDNIREDKVEAVCDERTIQFRLPSEISEATGESVWPKTLVLDSFKEGNQSILSAYFIYRLN